MYLFKEQKCTGSTIPSYVNFQQKSNKILVVKRLQVLEENKRVLCVRLNLWRVGWIPSEMSVTFQEVEIWVEKPQI